MAVDVSPPTYLKTPVKLTEDPSLKGYFEQLEFIVYKLWKRTNDLQTQINNLQFSVVEADTDYQVLLYDNAINCAGTFTVTLVDIADAVKPIIVTSTNGTITVVGDATIQGSTSLTTGTGTAWYPARGEWWRK